MVRKWVRMEDANGPEVLKHKNCNKVWTPEEKLNLITQVIAGKSYKSVAIENGINEGILYQWVHKYKVSGYNGLVNNKKCRPPKNPEMKKLTALHRENLKNPSTKNLFD